MISQHTAVVPGQRSAEISKLPVENDQLARAALAVKAGELIVFENGPVMALAGDANDPQLQQKISRVKRDRSPNQPVGWVSTFDPAIAAFDLGDIENKKVFEFLTNPEEITRRLGGLAFLRCQANQFYKERMGISDAIIPNQIVGEPPVEVQIYSPTGNARCSKFGRYTTSLSVQLIMTSANYHTEKEIVSYEAADSFAKEADNLMFCPQYAPGDKQNRPRGSYPVIRVLPDRLQVIRYGFIEPQLLERVLHDLPLDTKSIGASQKPNHPDHILRIKDLNRHNRSLRGEDMRHAILETFMEPNQSA